MMTSSVVKKANIAGDDVCSLENLEGGFLSRGFLSGGLCPGGFCPGGFCPDTIT